MGKCSCHPEIETSWLCMKHNLYLCEDCLTCRDPKIYCKYRSSCPIWFMDKRQKGLDADNAAENESVQHTVTFLPSGATAAVSGGTTLLEAARAADVHINASCNGKGSCGKCILIVESGDVSTQSTPLLTDAQREKGYVLACQTRVTGDVAARIPEEALKRQLQVAGMGREVTQRVKGLVSDIEPMLKEMPLTLSPPTLDDAVSDLDRLNRGLKKVGCDVARLNVGLRVMRQLADTMRDDHWEVTVSVIRRKCANEILEVRPGKAAVPFLGVAIDVGTTTIVVYLVDMTDGTVMAATAGHNRQADCGDDVINRIVCAEKDGVKKLSRMALATINDSKEPDLQQGGRLRRVQHPPRRGGTRFLNGRTHHHRRRLWPVSQHRQSGDHRAAARYRPQYVQLHGKQLHRRGLHGTVVHRLPSRGTGHLQCHDLYRLQQQPPVHGCLHLCVVSPPHGSGRLSQCRVVPVMLPRRYISRGARPLLSRRIRPSIIVSQV